MADIAQRVTSPQSSQKNTHAEHQDPTVPRTPIPAELPVHDADQFRDDTDDNGEEMAAAGKVNELGEVIDDEGNVIGKVTEGHGDVLHGSIVTQEGDVLDADGNVIGRAEPLEDIEEAAQGATRPATSTFGSVKDSLNYATRPVTSAIGSIGGRLGKTTKPATETLEAPQEHLEDAAHPVIEGAEGVKDKVEEGAEPVTEGIEGAKNTVEETAEPVTEQAKETTDGVHDTVGEATKPVTETVEGTKETAEKAAEPITEEVEGVKDTTADATEPVTEQVEGAQEKLGETAEPLTGEVEGVKDKVEETAEPVTDQVEDAQEAIEEGVPSIAGTFQVLNQLKLAGPFEIAADGNVLDKDGQVIGKLAEGEDIEKLAGEKVKGITEDGQLIGENESVHGKVDLLSIGHLRELDLPELPPISVLDGMKINKLGNVVDEKGNLLGKITKGDPKRLAGKTVSKDGKIWDNAGNVIGEAEVLAEAVEALTAPFEDFPGAIVDKSGKILFEGRQVGIVSEGDISKLIGKTVDADGDILDKYGNVVGKAERQEEEEPEPEPEEVIDYSILKDKKINKAGNAVDDKGQVYGRVIQGVLKLLIGRKVGDNGEIFNDGGKVIGKVEPIPENEREDFKESAPFEDFPDAVVESDGKVRHNGEAIGIVVEGDPKKLKGKKVDPDGDIVDKNGNVIGKAERWEEDEPEPEPEIDMSALAGKRVNKAGNVVDKSGEIYGRVIEGDIKRLIGKMCDRNGFIRNEGGDVIGKAELIPEAEREGMKEGPFTDMPGCTVNKDGKVVTSGGDVVGRLIEGDPKKLYGRAVDDDGDICDKNGNVLGKAERWEEPEVPEEEKDINPMSGRKVNKKGEVVDENGDVVGKLTSGDLSICVGKSIDDDGDVVDSKGSIIGHVNLLEDIPEPEPEPEEGETPEQKEKREQLEQDRKIAGQIAMCIEQSLDKIRPILKMITNLIDKAERTPKEELDEEELVKQVKPLIEEGGKILTEANGVIRGLDPDGRIAANAKHKTAAREATPEEYRLADLLKELTGTVTETIDNARRKIEDMPHAKKELNPLWGLLSEPLFQILAAVGLLLSGVLGLVGKLLSGLGLGGLVDNLLGGLGLTRLLDNLGLGMIVDSLTGKKNRKK